MLKEKKYLIVEDEELLRDSLCLFLASEGNNVKIAANGEEALNILRTEHIDCVISDVCMPKCDGLTLIRQTRQENNDVPFIFFSAHLSDALTKELFKYGALECLDKPLVTALFDTLEKIKL